MCKSGDTHGNAVVERKGSPITHRSYGKCRFHDYRSRPSTFLCATYTTRSVNSSTHITVGRISGLRVRAHRTTDGDPVPDARVVSPLSHRSLVVGLFHYPYLHSFEMLPTVTVYMRSRFPYPLSITHWCISKPCPLHVPLQSGLSPC
jgi:hypothetical protein